MHTSTAARPTNKLKEYDTTIEDFSGALMLDPNGVDAFRRAAADEERSKLLAHGATDDRLPSGEMEPLVMVAPHADDPEPVTVMTLRGTLDHSTSQRLEDLLQRLILEGHARILVDCHELRHCDSRSASIFLSQLRTLRLAGGDLKLFDLSDRARAIFETLGLAELIHMDFPDRASALRAFDEPLPAAWRDAIREGWVGLLNSHDFHRPSCEAVKGQDPAFQVWFETEDEAVLAGCSLCSECS